MEGCGKRKKGRKEKGKTKGETKKKLWESEIRKEGWRELVRVML